MKNRLVIAGTVVAACGALVVPGLLTSANAETPPAAPVAAAPAAPAAPVSPPPTRDAAPEHEVLGDVIGTGRRDSSGELVFYGAKLQEPQLPNTTFGIMGGIRDAAGGLQDVIVANEFAGSDKAPGFHAVTGGANLDGHDVPSFGYYAGPAAKITAAGNVVAHQAKWSADPNVVVFWFDSAADPGRLRAYDAAGNNLPAGHTGAGHG
ncbi:hypothetical protein OG439_39490 [Amycolatopsis sp. NBC_01307]|uniref:hypothetical protein n=1 Tax=Amycolatopsis sp. NBC_01307 TaxID=2903561 RepID=UPI002E0D88B3|nr:hypothetical protein OG439_39490 [Amycolatopsis sp. NBC_01307]